MSALSGRDLRTPYSFSRWTDVPAAKWGWFRERLAEGSFVGFAEQSLTPQRWSLRPEDTEKLVIWTRNPRALFVDRHLLEPYDLHIHHTLTGWCEAEIGSPNPVKGLGDLKMLLDLFGPDRVTWRFTPIPATPDSLDRWVCLAENLKPYGVKHVTAAFSSGAGYWAEDRSEGERAKLLADMAQVLPFTVCGLPYRPVTVGDCRGPEGLEGVVCGCRPMVDPFSINESCVYRCRYCYAADTSLSSQRRNTTLNNRL